jgi:hypothetical protein
MPFFVTVAAIVLSQTTPATGTSVDVPTALGIAGGFWLVITMFKPLFQRLWERVPGLKNGGAARQSDCPAVSEATRIQWERMVALQEKTVDRLDQIHSDMRVESNDRQRILSMLDEIVRRN